MVVIVTHNQNIAKLADTVIHVMSGKICSIEKQENPKVSGMQRIVGEKYDPESMDAIWLSDQYARENKIHLGDGLEIQLFGESIKAEVKGLIKSSKYSICMRDKAQINVISDLPKEDFPKKVDETFGRTMMVIDKEEKE